MTEVAEAIKKENVYIVQFANWRVEVPINDINLTFSTEVQMLEAASRAVECFKGYNRHDLEVISDNNEELSLGGACLVFKKGTDGVNGSLIFTGILLANGGYYKDSWDVIQKTDEHLHNTLPQNIPKEFQSEKIQKEIDEYEKITQKMIKNKRIVKKEVSKKNIKKQIKKKKRKK
jgi:hypothetical protein